MVNTWDLLPSFEYTRNGGSCTIRSNGTFLIKGIIAKSKKDAIGYVLTFATVKGRGYNIVTE